MGKSSQRGARDGFRKDFRSQGQRRKTRARIQILRIDNGGYVVTEFDAVGKEIFQELYRSIVNVYYHQALATRWELLGWGVDAVSAVLILMGVVLAAWPWMGLKLPKVQREDLARHDEETRAITKKQLKWSLGTAAIGFVLLLLPFKSYSQENKDLVAAWSENRNRVDALESRFYQLDKTKNVPPEIKAEILAIRQAGTGNASRDLSRIARHRPAATRRASLPCRPEAPLRRYLAGDGGAGDKRRGRKAARDPSHPPCP